MELVFGRRPVKGEGQKEKVNIIKVLYIHV
jgi:hypothetical protein